jgi:EmrB/QacA subfamily drug resistance transporter
VNARATPTGSTNQRLLLITIAAGTMLAPLNSTMIAVALPDIQRAFDTSVTATAWLVTIYLIAMAVGQPIGGRLGDQYGRRPVYLVGLAWFAIASLGCAFAPGLGWLVAFRVQQAMAGTLVFPNGAALVREAIPADRRGLAFGMIGLSASVAAASGPPIGGVLAHAFGWASIFWVNLPLVALVIVLAWRSLPQRHGPGPARSRLDLGGIGLMTVALGTVMLTPTLLNVDRPALAAGVVLVGVAAGWAFVRRERRVAAPIVDLALFRRQHFAAACASILLGNLVMYTTLLAIPLYLEHARGESSSRTGLMLGAMSMLAALATPVGGRWSDRQGRWQPAVAGAAVTCAGTFLIGLALLAGGAPLLVAALAVMGLGLGIAGAPVQAASVESVPAAQSGSASGIYSTSRYVGSVIGTSALALLFATEPDPTDTGRFVALFMALGVVAIAGILANSRIADRDPATSPAATAHS